MELLSIRETARRLSIGRTALWKLTKEPDFPKPIAITVGRKAFVAEEIDEWIRLQISKRDEAGTVASLTRCDR